MDDSKKYKILIIDDDNFLLDMYAMKFSQEPKFSVDTALGSMAAYEKLKAGASPDVMLMDVVMPGMDGFELLEKLRDEKIAEGVMKIILSNRGQQSDIERGATLGVAGYIVKASSTPSEVITKVTEIVTKQLPR